MLILRSREELGPTPRLLASAGIARVPDVYSVSQLAAINLAMNPFFMKRENEKRSYIRSDDALELGIFDSILSPSMLDLFFSIMPDPVIYHFHAYEIAARSNQPHIFADQLGGWHRDPDSYYFADDPTHVSVFIYLSRVGPSDGVFEFCPQHPTTPLRGDSPVVSMVGDAGLTFAWHRSFYHRASPNSGPRRRRLIKISIQSNQFISHHLRQPFFRRTLAEVPSGDPKIDILLGRFQGKKAPRLSPRKVVTPSRLYANAMVDLTTDALQYLVERENATRDLPVDYD